jgi:hypothetical protein
VAGLLLVLIQLVAEADEAVPSASRANNDSPYAVIVYSGPSMLVDHTRPCRSRVVISDQAEIASPGSASLMFESSQPLPRETGVLQGGGASVTIRSRRM